MDLPPRLSNRQQFILAWLALEEGGPRIGRLSHAVAEEFGGVIDRKERGQSVAEESDDPLATASLLGLIFTGMDQRVLSPEHRASFSRSVSRLADRDLVTELIRSYRPTNRTVWVELTDSGREVGEEILRRHRDGRYSLSFNTIE